MVESAYTGASKASARKGLRVRVPLPARLRCEVCSRRSARWVGVACRPGGRAPRTPTFRRVASGSGGRPARLGWPADPRSVPVVRWGAGPGRARPAVRLRRLCAVRRLGARVRGDAEVTVASGRRWSGDRLLIRVTGEAAWGVVGGSAPCRGRRAQPLQLRVRRAAWTRASPAVRRVVSGVLAGRVGRMGCVTHMTPDEFREYGPAGRGLDRRLLGEHRVASGRRAGQARRHRRRCCPSTAPEKGEPFAAVLADIDRVVMPGITHWQHPVVLRVLPGQRVRAGGARGPAELGARRAGDALGHLAGGDRGRDRRDGLAGQAARPAGAVPRLRRHPGHRVQLGALRPGRRAAPGLRRHGAYRRDPRAVRGLPLPRVALRRREGGPHRRARRRRDPACSTSTRPRCR